VIRSYLYDPTTNRTIRAEDFAVSTSPRVEAGEAYLTTVTPQDLHSTFKSATRTTAGTTTVVTPPSNGSIIVNDVLISGEKQAGSTIEVRFTDGANNVTLFLASQVDVPASFAHSFKGRVQGWKDARIEMVTVGTADATVTIVYSKVRDALPYAEWDALR
jgi:hypothetical protein